VSSSGPDKTDLLSMGAVLATCVIGGFGLGWLVDSTLGTFPGLALAGMGAGIVAASVYAYKLFKRFS
jgi:F0F1-type ATP synthase assembly protein I